MKKWAVEKWIRDQDLEGVLNKDGYEPYRMFRNGASWGAPETTTIVFKRVDSDGSVGTEEED